jgi:hypothetical protein
MFGSTILDVVVGVIFVYLLASLMVTATTELIAGWLSWRADKLWDGTRNLLSSPGAEDWAQKLYDHALIRGLSPLASKEASVAKIRLAPVPKGPSYIPSHTFSAALLDLVQNLDPTIINIKKNLQELLDRIPSSTSSTSAVKKEALSLASAIPAASQLGQRVKTDFQVLANNIPDIDLSIDKLRQEVRDVINRLSDLDSTRASLKRDLQNLITKPTPPGYSTASLKNDIQELIKNVPYSASTAQLVKKDLQELINRFPEMGDSTAAAKQVIQVFADRMLDKYFADIIGQIPNPNVRTTLSALFEESGRDLGKLKETVETWFNDAMDRVSGWYKRQTQAANLLLGIAFTLALNLDTVLIVKVLSNTNSGLRESLVAQAQKFAQHPSIQIDVSQAAQPSLSPTSADGQKSSAVVDRNPEDEYQLLKSQFDNLNLPIGWTTQQGKNTPGLTSAGSRNSDFSEWPGWSWQGKEFGHWLRNWGDTIGYHFIGWALTAIAVSLGAPFWFDVLNRIVAIRSTGSVPADQAKPPQQTS